VSLFGCSGGEYPVLAWVTRPAGAVARWDVWRVPTRVLGYVLAVDILAVAATAAATVVMPVTHADWVRFGVLAACTVLHVEVTRSVERSRHIVNGAGPSMNTDAVWCIAAVIALPIVLASAIVVLVFVWSWLRVWRGRRPLYRWVFSGATVLIATDLAAAILALGPGPHPGVSLAPAGLAITATAAVLRWLINFVLVAAAIVLASPRMRAGQLLDNIGERVLEIGAFGLGLIAAYLVVHAPVLLLGILLAVLAMHRVVLINEFRKDARTDSKTQLANAAWWNEIARRALECAIAGDTSMGVLMLDIDHFKKINDVHGHIAGDQVLRAVGNVLVAEIRDTDTAGRWGGEEFAIVLPDVDHQELAAIAERIRLRILSTVITVEGTDGPEAIHDVAVSIGGASYPLSGTTTLDELLLAADAALYQAKQNGRNRVCLDHGRPAPPSTIS
jgi:diguanylate cyclase (GGDEF)-like protein